MWYNNFVRRAHKQFSERILMYSRSRICRQKSLRGLHSFRRNRVSPMDYNTSRVEFPFEPVVKISVNVFETGNKLVIKISQTPTGRRLKKAFETIERLEQKLNKTWWGRVTFITVLVAWFPGGQIYLLFRMFRWLLR